MRRPFLPALVALALALAVPATGAAQASTPPATSASGPADSRLPLVRPGGVATVLVRIPGPTPVGAPPHYDLRLADGFRPFVGTTGAVPAPDPEGAEPLRLPLTFGVPGDAAAGPMVAGILRVESAGGRVAVDTIRVRVDAVRRVEATLATHAALAAPGQPVELEFRVRNLGNATDTLELRLLIASDWSVDHLPGPIVLAAADSAAGLLRVRPPARALVGHEQSVTLEARGAGTADRATVSLLIAEPEPPVLADWSHLPTTVFIGNSIGAGAGTGVAVRGAGTVAPDTRLGLSLRHTDTHATAPAFRSDLLGPRLQVALSRPDLQVTAGEVRTAGDIFSSPLLNGRGVAGRFQRGAWTADLHAARPGGLGSELGGHQLLGSVAREVGPGQLGFTVSDIREARSWFPGYRSTAAGLGYVLDGYDGHTVSVRTGLLRVTEDDGEVAFGPTAESEYRLRTADTRLSARARWVPGTVGRNAAVANELFVHAIHRLNPGVSLTAWGQLRETPLLGAEDDPSVASLSLGARTRLGAASLDLGGTHRRLATGAKGDVTRTTAEIDLELPVGSVVLEGNAEVGRFDRGATIGPVRRFGAAARWLDGASWARVGARFDDSEYARRQLLLDVAGAVEWNGAELSGGASHRFDGRAFAESFRFWSSLQLELRGDLALTAGADYQPGLGDERWRFSAGASHRLGVPLPIPRPPALHGVVYEDRNGDRIRDPDEPLVAGVRVRIGRIEERTGVDGRFGFRETFGGTLEIDPGSLPAGTAVPAQLHLPSSGAVEVPVVRAGIVRVQLFLDRNGDAARDPGEDPAGGFIVSLVDERGVGRDMAADDGGRARFGAVPPGLYTLRVFRPAGLGQATAATDSVVIVAPGAVVEHVLAVPARTRAIQMGTGARLDLERQRGDTSNTSSGGSGSPSPESQR